MRIGIVSAMQPELAVLKENLNNSKEFELMGLNFFEGTIGNLDIILSLSGMGKVNAAIGAVVLINHFKCDLIINSGIAGGVAPLQKRDSVIATALYYNDVDARYFGYKFGQVPGMPEMYEIKPHLIEMVEKVFNKLNLTYKKTVVVSGDQFVTSLDQLKDIPHKEGIATEMEGAAIAQVAHRANVDFIILRYISDIVGAENQEEEYSKFEEEMSMKSSQVTLQLLKNLE